MIERLIAKSQSADNTDTYLTNREVIDDDVSILEGKHPRSLGSIYTPPDFAQFLTSWAIQIVEQKVLDIGIGEGAFIFSAYERLKELGAKEINAQQQLYGSEIGCHPELCVKEG